MPAAALLAFLTHPAMGDAYSLRDYAPYCPLLVLRLRALCDRVEASLDGLGSDELVELRDAIRGIDADEDYGAVAGLLEAIILHPNYTR